MTTTKTFCSICSAFCGFEAEIKNNSIVSLTPDKTHPMSKGFSCSKGRNFHHLISSDKRISHCQKQNPDGWKNIPKNQALDDIATQLQSTIAEHGPESVAVYCGNGVTFKALTMPSIHAFMQGLGSHQVYTSLTIDQPAKITSVGRHGIWAGGIHSFESANVLMLIGNNPLVSGLHGPGSIPGWRPGALKEEKKRGLKLIVIDPRLTETAQQADFHLPIKPGTDAILLSGMINYILQNGLEDKPYCKKFTTGLTELATYVASYDLEKTATLTGLCTTQIKQATDLFISQERGTVSSGTGPDMAPHANLTEHLISSMNTLCGRVNRAGDIVSGSLLTPDFPPMEAAVPFGFLPEALNPAHNTKRSRVSGAHQLYKEMPTATLAEEILTPGKGQIKALLVVGGNPMLSIPDQDQTRKALETLDLLVCIDGRRSETAELASYFLPASYGLEKTDMTVFNDVFWGKPFHQISHPLVSPPDDACDEPLYLAALAQRLGTPMPYAGGDINTAKPPTGVDMLSLIFPESMSKVAVHDIASHEGGHIYEQYSALEVIPAMEGMDDKLHFMPVGVADEFTALSEDISNFSHDGDYLLICRRNPHVYNSMCHDFPQAPEDNPAWLHPDDIEKSGLQQGQRITITSEHGNIEATLQADKTMRAGVVSINHGFGGDHGVAVSQLLSTKESTDHYTRIPQMSALPVSISGIST